MIARAPGKLLLSGSYVVLDGAPALVTAVDRFVDADAQRPAPRITDEVRALLEAGAAHRLEPPHVRRVAGDPERGADAEPGAAAALGFDADAEAALWFDAGAAAPWFDASTLRVAGPDGGRKLGIGSSGAILAASLGALAPPRTGETQEAWRARLLPAALAAHHRAQGGGSGVDVAASVLGGTLRCTLTAAGLEARAHALPTGVHIEAWAHATSASTAALLGALRAVRSTDATRVQRALDAAAAGARAAAAAADVDALVAAIDAQHVALAALSPEVPAVLPELAALRTRARDEAATFAPSGAGGGDVSIFVGRAPSTAELRAAAEGAGLTRLELQIGARGLHLAS